MSRFKVRVTAEVTMTLEVEGDDEWDAKNNAEIEAEDVLLNGVYADRVTTGFARVIERLPEENPL
jgi:hypothetical protein